MLDTVTVSHRTWYYTIHGPLVLHGLVLCRLMATHLCSTSTDNIPYYCYYQDTDVLYGLLLHIYVSWVHGYTNARTTACHIIIIVTWILGIALLHMHVWFLYSCHMDSRSDYMYYCSMLPYSCYMIVSCHWYGYSRYWTWELLIRDMWNPTSIVPVSCYIIPVILFPFPVILFYAINRAQVQLSCYPYHVFVLVTLYTWHIRS